MTLINSELIIDPAVFRKNITYIKNKLKKSSKFLAVIKSDAYGHHLERIVGDIDDLVDGYGVVRTDEAKKIRQLSSKKILLMQGVYSQDEFMFAKENGLDLVIHNKNQFEIINDNEKNYYENLWFKVNTGMNRLGFEIDEFMRIYNEFLLDKKFILMTHLSSSNDVNSSSNQQQFKLFEELSKKLNSKVEKSIANTGCIMNFPKQAHNWVRCGIGIYGGYMNDKEIKTAMTLRSPIINIRTIQKDEKVGYDGRAVAKDEMKIASVYIGYADGLPVNIKDGTKVLINDQEAEVFGKVSMDLTTINVSNISSCKVGDWVEFFSPRFPISNVAKSNDLISYYLMTSVKSRVKKIYKSLK